MRIELFICNNEPASNGLLNGTYVPDNLQIGDTICDKDVDYDRRFIVTSIVYTTRNSALNDYTCVIAASRNLPT